MAKQLVINKRQTTKRKAKKTSHKVAKNDLAQAKLKVKADKTVETPYKLRYKVMRQKLGFLGNLISDSELHKLVDMDTPAKSIIKRIKQRIFISMFTVIAGCALSLFVSGSVKTKATIAGASVGVAAVLWFANIRQTSAYYRNWQLARQLAFAQFTRLAAAYLPELAAGNNLYSIFKKLLPRMKDDKDRTALEGLMINMQIDPEDPKPFLDFAHKFTASDSAELIMLTIQQMYLGDVSDKNIRVLADDANKDMIRQIDTVINYKLRKFQQMTTIIAMLSMIVVFGFLMSLLWYQFSSAFKLMGDASNGSKKALNIKK